MDDTLTVAELAAAIGPKNPAQQDLYLRRTRQLSALRVLPTVGPVHAGPGRHRRYKPETAYVAAVLMRLVDLGHNIAVLSLVNRALSTDLGADETLARLWETARKKRPGGQSIFLGIGINVGENPCGPREVNIYCAEGQGLITPQFYLENDGLVVLNLTDLFASVRV